MMTVGPAVLGRSALSFLCVVTLSGTAPGRAQVSGNATSAASPQSTTQAAKPKATPGRLGVWRRFGESPDGRVKRGEFGQWHRFGESPEGKPALQESLVSRRLGSGHIGDLEQQMCALINRQRADPANARETRGLALPLTWNEQLAAVARAHSQDMLARGYFDHEDPEGRSAGMRIEAAGLPWQAVAENIAIFPDVTEAEAAFMNEPRFRQNHRGNTLNPKYTEVGVGIVQGPDGRYYITQDFLTSPTANRAGP